MSPDVLVATWILGFVLGALGMWVVCNAVYYRRYEAVLDQLARLEVALAERQERIDRLTEQVNLQHFTSETGR